MTGLVRIGEEVEDQFELWALINREKHFEGERGLDGERKWGRKGGGERRGKMTLVCCKEFLNLRVVRTSATIWSISNPWATFALMRLKQDGEGVADRGVEGEYGWWGRRWAACRGLQRAPRQVASRVSLSSEENKVCGYTSYYNVSRHRFRSSKYFLQLPFKG